MNTFRAKVSGGVLTRDFACLPEVPWSPLTMFRLQRRRRCRRSAQSLQLPPCPQPEQTAGSRQLRASVLLRTYLKHETRVCARHDRLDFANQDLRDHYELHCWTLHGGVNVQAHTDKGPRPCWTTGRPVIEAIMVTATRRCRFPTAGPSAPAPHPPIRTHLNSAFPKLRTPRRSRGVPAVT